MTAKILLTKLIKASVARVFSRGSGYGGDRNLKKSANLRTLGQGFSFRVENPIPEIESTFPLNSSGIVSLKVAVIF